MTPAFIDAISKYGTELTDSIHVYDPFLAEKYIIPICRFVAEEGVPMDDVFNILRRLGRRKVGNVWSMSFKELCEAYERIFPCDTLPLPNLVFRSSDGMVEIGDIRTWKEAQNIPMARCWCVSKKKDQWDNYTIHRQHHFYIIRNLNCSFNKNARFVLLVIQQYGQYDLCDSDDQHLYNDLDFLTVDRQSANFKINHLCRRDYLESLGEDGRNAVKEILLSYGCEIMDEQLK